MSWVKDIVKQSIMYFLENNKNDSSMCLMKSGQRYTEKDVVVNSLNTNQERHGKMHKGI